MSHFSSRLATRGLRALATAGTTGRRAAVAMESLRTTGPRVARVRMRQESALRRLDGRGFGSPLYGPIWEEAAGELGATVEPLGDDFLRIHLDGASTIVCGQAVMLDDVVTLRLADDKRLAHRLLSYSGLPVPDQLDFRAAAPEPAVRFLESHASACVVKPLTNSGGGAGATGSIRAREDVLRASVKGWRWSERLVIERQVPGLVYRLLLVDGELLDVVQRRSPTLVGDGRSTVAELVERENERRLEQRSLVGSLLRLDLDAILTLRAQEQSQRSVPAAGQPVQVKSATSQNARRDNETYRGPLADELVADARAAAATLGVRLAGIDIVTPDPSVALSDAGGAVIEVNGEPGLQHHYEVADPEHATRVAIPLLHRLLER